MAAALAAARAADTPGGVTEATDVGATETGIPVATAGEGAAAAVGAGGAATATDPAAVAGALLATASAAPAVAFPWPDGRSWFRLRLPLRLRLLLWLRERERLRSRRDDRSRLRLRSCRRWERELFLLREPPRSRLRLLDRLRLSEWLRRLLPLRLLPPRLELSVSWEREASNMGIKAGVCHYGYQGQPWGGTGTSTRQEALSLFRPHIKRPPGHQGEAP